MDNVDFGLDPNSSDVAWKMFNVESDGRDVRTGRAVADYFHVTSEPIFGLELAIATLTLESQVPRLRSRRCFAIERPLLYIEFFPSRGGNHQTCISFILAIDISSFTVGFPQPLTSGIGGEHDASLGFEGSGNHADGS